MEENYITMIMPTFNHPTYIEYFINNAVIPYTGTLFRFEIHDSSTNNDTKNLIDEYNENHNVKIKYFRYESNINGDLKTYKALCQCDKTHLYLMGDGVCPDFNKLEEYLIKNKYYEYDLFGIFIPDWLKRFKKDRFKTDIVYKEYKIEQFFDKFFHEFTYYGGSIISKKIWNYILENSIFEKYEFNGRYSYAYDSSIFTALAENSNYKYGASFISFYRGNPMKKANSWGHGDKLYQIGLQEFENDVTKLPIVYNPYKKSMFIKSRKVGFNFNSALYYKLENSLNFTLLKKYKVDLKHVKSNYYMLKFICFIPNWILKTAKVMKKTLKKILRRG